MPPFKSDYLDNLVNTFPVNDYKRVEPKAKKNIWKRIAEEFVKTIIVSLFLFAILYIGAILEG